MTSWIKNTAGDHALIEDEQVELWTRIRGWYLADEPGPTAQVWVHHDGLLPSRLPYEALAAGWADMGWSVGPPAEPVDPTREPPPPVAAEPASPAKKTRAAAGGDKSEE